MRIVTPAPRSLARVLASLAALAAGACFRDEAPPLGCAGAECTTTDAPGSTGAASSSTGAPTTGAPPAEPRTFRIDSLRLIDPHLFLESCVDATGIVNKLGLQDQIEAAELNLVLHFEAFDPAAPAAELGEATSCDLDAGTCVFTGDITLQVPVAAVTEPPCLALDETALAAESLKALFKPQPPCFRTGAAEIALPVNGAPAPIQLLASQLVFTFDEPADPQAVEMGVFHGFLTRSSAEATDLMVSGTTYNLWNMIAPPDTCVAQHQDLLPSVDQLIGDEGPIEGVWLAFNATARRVAVVPP